MVFDRAKEASDAEIFDWLRTSRWGRCAYRCDNDVVDHQVIAARFAGAVTAWVVVAGGVVVLKLWVNAGSMMRLTWASSWVM